MDEALPVVPTGKGAAENTFYSCGSVTCPEKNIAHRKRTTRRRTKTGRAQLLMVPRRGKHRTAIQEGSLGDILPGHDNTYWYLVSMCLEICSFVLGVGTLVAAF